MEKRMFTTMKKGCLQPWNQRMITTLEKKGLHIKNTPGYIQYADAYSFL